MMGRPNKKGKKTKKIGKQRKTDDGGTNKPNKFSVNQLLDKVNEYIDTFQYELAQKFCQRALELEPDNLRVLETSGILLLEVGEMEKAKHCFGRAIELSPENGHSKYMYMGQLLTGPSAIQCFQKGIELMQKYIVQLSTSQNEGACAEEPETEISNKDVSSAYCSMAEIYLTDECFEDEAENRCAECLENAIKEDNENPEAHHLFTSYWLSKDQKEKAKTSMSAGLSLWLPQWRDVCEKCEGEEQVDLTDACLLSYPARINVTKLLIELEDFNAASEILELLLDEDDEVLETWYLLGWVHYLQGGDFKQNARYYLGKAQKVSKTTDCPDDQIVQHTQELLAELGGPLEDDPEDVTENGANGDMEVHSDSDSDQQDDDNQMQQ